MKLRKQEILLTRLLIISLYFVLHLYSVENLSAQLKIVVNPHNYQAWIVNGGDLQISVDGWELSSDRQLLSPAGWTSMVDYRNESLANSQNLATIFGGGVVSLEKISSKANTLAETNLTNVVAWRAGDVFYIGMPFGSSGQAWSPMGGDAVFLYSEFKNNMSVVSQGKIDQASCVDFDFDGDTDSADLLEFMESWTGALEPGLNLRKFIEGDCDNDGDVDSGDMLEFLSFWTGSRE